MKYWLPLTKNRWKLLLCCSVMLLQAVLNEAVAQVEPLASEKFAIHPKVGFAFHSYSANFKSFQGTTDCGLFEKGSGSGVTGFVFGEIPLSPSSILGLGIGYTDRSGKLTVPGNFSSFDPITKTTSTISTENAIHATLGYLEIQPEVRAVIIPNFLSGPLRTVGAFRFAIPISASFIQDETIVTPGNAVFVDKNSQIRQIAAGQITTKSTGYGLSAGLENMLKIGANTFFTQQVLVDYNFTNIVSDADWKMMGVRIELGLRFSVLPQKDEPAPPQAPPPPPPQPLLPAPTPVLTLQITDIRGEVHSGNELLSSPPLVNAVFFQKQSSELSEKYDRNVADIQKTPNVNPVENHTQILTQIAKIVKNNPKATLVLEGATSGAEDEPQGLELAGARMESVKKALVNLGVEQSKITGRSALMPRNPSNQDFPEGRIENRRVDILVQNAPLQEYVSRNQYSEVNGVASAIINTQNIPATEKVVLTSNCLEKPITENLTTSLSLPLKCRISNEQKEFTFTADAQAQSVKATASKTITVASLMNKQVELNVDNFKAILRFDYNSSDLSQSNKDLLKQMIEPLPAGTSITVYGSTDALGSGTGNQQLSQKRAKVTEDYIRSLSGEKFKISTETETDKFPELTPEGRFLNRSMRIRLKK